MFVEQKEEEGMIKVNKSRSKERSKYINEEALKKLCNNHVVCRIIIITLLVCMYMSFIINKKQ